MAALASAPRGLGELASLVRRSEEPVSVALALGASAVLRVETSVVVAVRGASP
jgi:hypothetical protein